MTHLRDLIEAERHERRRLVSAFLSGAESPVTSPGTPPRLRRALALGVLLGVVAAGALRWPSLEVARTVLSPQQTTCASR